MKVLKEDFEKGEKLIPELVVERYNEMKEISEHPEKKLDDFLREFPEVKDARSKDANADWSHGQAAIRVEEFREKHPLKAAIKIGKGYRLQEEERSTKEALEKAQKGLDRTWNDPRLREKAGQISEPWSRVSRGGMVIDGNRRWQLDELKPYYEQAQERIDKSEDLGLDKDLSKGLGLGPEDEANKEVEKGQEHELKIEKGFGFDRGFGF